MNRANDSNEEKKIEEGNDLEKRKSESKNIQTFPCR
jgi:hypothetical protein